jgi:hypothetical protein
MFPKALILYLGTSGAKPMQRLSLLLYLPANSSLTECDCSFLFMFHQTAEKVLLEKINKKDYFLLRWWSIESVPEISLPPCIAFPVSVECKDLTLFGLCSRGWSLRQFQGNAYYYHKNVALFLVTVSTPVLKGTWRRFGATFPATAFSLQNFLRPGTL